MTEPEVMFALTTVLLFSEKLRSSGYFVGYQLSAVHVPPYKVQRETFPQICMYESLNRDKPQFVFWLLRDSVDKKKQIICDVW